jgi:hypothetical protein
MSFHSVNRTSGYLANDVSYSAMNAILRGCKIDLEQCLSPVDGENRLRRFYAIDAEC